MKRTICTILAVIIFCLSTPFASASTVKAQNYTLFSSQEELKARIKSEISKELAAQGIMSDVYYPGDPMSRNSIDDYKTEIVATNDNVIVSGYAGNQPSRGVTFNSSKGGTFFYSPGGGPSLTLSVSFGSPYGITSVTFGLGVMASGVTAYSVSVPGFQAYKLWIDNTYMATKYIVYKRIWVDDFTGYQWVEYSGGVNKELVNVALTPIAV